MYFSYFESQMHKMASWSINVYVTKAIMEWNDWVLVSRFQKKYSLRLYVLYLLCSRWLSGAFVPTISWKWSLFRPRTLIKEGSLFMRWGGGAHLPQILISLAYDLIWANNFIRVPLFSLRIPKNSKSKIFCPPKWRVQNVPPLRDTSKIFRPPPLTKKLKVLKIPTKH